MGNAKIMVSEFGMYGLNRYRNFMSPPGCEGCENYETCEHVSDSCAGDHLYIAKTKDELLDMCAEFLKMHDCSESAIFVVYNNGSQMVVYNLEEEDQVGVTEPIEPDIHYFAEFDASMRLCCYSLLIEKEDGMWKVAQ